MVTAPMTDKTMEGKNLFYGSSLSCIRRETGPNPWPAAPSFSCVPRCCGNSQPAALPWTGEDKNPQKSREKSTVYSSLTQIQLLFFLFQCYTISFNLNTEYLQTKLKPGSDFTVRKKNR